MTVRRPLETGLVVFILLVAVVSRFYGLDRLSLWSDELWVVMASTAGSLADVLANVYSNDNHPPGYYLLSRWTQQLFGTSDFAIRLPSALAGVLLVYSVWHIGKQHLSVTAAVVAAALAAGSYPLVYYSQEARPNVFVALFALWALHGFYKRQPWLFACAAAACMYFHYAGLVLVLCFVPVYAVQLLYERNWQTLKQGLWLFVPALLLFSPWIPGTLYDLMHSPPEYWQRTPNLQTLNQTFWFLFGPDDFRVWCYKLALLFVVIVMGVTVIQRRVPAFPALLLAMSLLPVAVFFVKSLVSQSAYNHRHFLFVIPFVALLAGWIIDKALQRLPASGQQPVLLVLLVLVILYQALANQGRALYSANHFKQEYREVSALVAKDNAFHAETKTMVIANLHFFDHYLKRFSSPRTISAIYETQAEFEGVRQLIAVEQVTQFYYLEAPLIPGANRMVTEQDQTLAQHYRAVCRTRFLRAQAIKWAVATPQAVDWENLPTCP